MTCRLRSRSVRRVRSSDLDADHDDVELLLGESTQSVAPIERMLFDTHTTSVVNRREPPSRHRGSPDVPVRQPRQSGVDGAGAVAQ